MIIVIFLYRINGYKLMFTCDAGIEKEKDILDKYNISDIVLSFLETISNDINRKNT